MAEIPNQNETQSDPNDVNLVNYYREFARNASSNSNLNNSNLEQTFRDSEQNSNQIENQSNQNQHHQSSNNVQQHHQSNSNQNFQQTEMNENIYNNANKNANTTTQSNTKPNANAYLQSNNQPNPQEETNNQVQNNSITRNTNTNAYLQPDPQERINLNANPTQQEINNLLSIPLQNSYTSSPNELDSIPIEQVPRNLPPYVRATPKLLADVDPYPIEDVVKGCGENVPWTDLFFHLIGKGPSRLQSTEKLISLFSKKAQEVGEELIDAYIDGNFDYLEKFRVDVGGIAGGRKYLKSNILFKFPIDAHGIYKDNRNSMKVASQELRVINHLVNETSLNRLFVLPCLALITKCGLRMYASSLLPLNPKESLKYGCEDLKQSNRIIKKDDQTMNNIFNLISQTLNLKNHSIVGDLKNLEVICADIEGHLGTDGNYYLVDTTRLFPPESPFNQNANNNNSNNELNEHLFTFLRPELVKTSQNPLNNDCFSVFWNGNENQRKEEEGNIRKLSDSIDSTLIPELSHSIQNETIQINNCDAVKKILHDKMLCLHHLPYLIEKILVDFSKFSNEARKSLNVLLIEMFTRILKWKWYSLRGNEKQKQSGTVEMMNQYVSKSNEDKISNWIQLLNEFFSVRAIRLKNMDQFIEHCSQFLEKSLFEEVLTRFDELCGIKRSYLESRITFRSILKIINLPKPKALKELIELKNEQELKFGKDSLILASTLLELARFHNFLSKQPNITESGRFYEECFRIYELHGKQNEWQTLFIQLEFIQIRNWDKDCLEQCLSIKSEVEKHIGKQHPDYAETLHHIGIALCQQDKFEESLKYFEESLKIQEQTIGKQHPTYAQTLCNIGMLFEKQSKFEESLKYYEEGLKIYEQTIGKQNANYAQTLFKIGDVLQKQGKFEESFKYFEECLKIQEQTIEKQHPNYATTLFNIGLLFQKQNKFEESLKYYEECLKIEEQTIGKQHPNYANTLNNIGNVLQNQGKFEKSFKYFEECLKIREQTIGKQHPNYAITLNNIGIVLYQQGKFEESFKYYEECLKIYEPTIGKQHANYASTLYNIGNNLQKQGKFEESFKYFDKCLKIQEQTIGKLHPDYTITLNNIGKNFQMQGKFDESLKYFEECLKIYKQTIGKQHPNYATTLNNIGFVLEQQGKFEESLKYYEESLKIYEQTIGKQRPDYAITLFNIGNNLQNQNKFEESLKYYEECLKIYEQTIGKQHPICAMALSNIGIVLQKQGKFEESLKYLEEGLKIYKQTIGKQHSDYAKTLNDIENNLRSLKLKIQKQETNTCNLV